MVGNGIRVPAPQPVAVVSVALLQNGQIATNVQGANPVMAIGMLEFAKSSLIAQAQQSPGIEVAPSGFPTGRTET